MMIIRIRKKAFQVYEVEGWNKKDRKSALITMSDCELTRVEEKHQFWKNTLGETNVGDINTQVDPKGKLVSTFRIFGPKWTTLDICQTLLEAQFSRKYFLEKLRKSEK
jgi:hypothetical protein